MPAFLSNAWMDELDKLRGEAPEPPASLADLVINITVTGAPDGDTDVHMAGGQFERGHAEGAPTKLTVPYDVAKKLFIDQDQSAAMQAFMSGQIKVEGDMTKLMAMQGGGAPSAEQEAFAAKIKAITD
jgi:putative sterol carrier protein